MALHFVTLFNLQGARRLSGTSDTIAGFPGFVKTFFKKIFRFFEASGLSVRPVSFLSPPLADSLRNITDSPRFVNTLFEFFSAAKLGAKTRFI